MAKKIETDKPLQQQIEELEALITWFESDGMNLEEAITKFEEGGKMAESIKERLSQLENKITVLKERFDESA